MVPEDLRESLLSPLYDLKRLKVEIINKPKGQLVDLISSLLWLAPHPNFISILLDSREKILKVYSFPISEVTIKSEIMNTLNSNIVKSQL